MKITREINGQIVEIELTSEEVRAAYLEKEREQDIQDVKTLLESLDPEEFYEKHQISLNWAYDNDALVEKIADEMRRCIDKYDMHWDKARDDALNVIIDNYERDFQYYEVDRLEELKNEFAKKHGWLGEDDEFASTWWENDKNLQIAEEYAYTALGKERLYPLEATDNEKASLESIISQAEDKKVSNEKGYGTVNCSREERGE